MERSGSELDLPGFRFHPTEEELLDYYLRRVAKGKKLNFDIIGTLNIYRHDPSELPKLSKIGEREWYFFVPRDRRSGNGGRPNRTTERGFWKATGSDRPIRSSVDPKRLIGLKKTLVFYTGRAPRGCKTDWVMNEYRLPDSSPSTPPPKEDIVLCKVYRKATSLKELEQRAAVEEETRATRGCVWIVDDFLSDGHNLMSLESSTPSSDGGDVKKEMEDEVSGKIEVEAEAKVEKVCPPAHLPELQLPNHNLEWMHDSFLTQLRSPWPDPWSPYANILNF